MSNLRNNQILKKERVKSLWIDVVYVKIVVTPWTISFYIGKKIVFFIIICCALLMSQNILEMSEKKKVGRTCPSLYYVANTMVKK